MAGVRTTSSSRVLDDLVATEDAAAVARLRARGAAVIGKTETHEYALGVTTPQRAAIRDPTRRGCACAGGGPSTTEQEAPDQPTPAFSNGSDMASGLPSEGYVAVEHLTRQREEVDMRALPAMVGVGAVSTLLLVSVGFETSAFGAQPTCTPVRNGRPVTGNQDALAQLLAKGGACPRDVVALRARIKEHGGTLSTAFINNRGFHNPAAGSFSLFEVVTGPLTSIGRVGSGEFFFGHFTAPDGMRLVLNQSPADKNLMIEAIAWDPAKGMFNFYELNGTGSTGRWDYNGDSADILADTALLHRQRRPGEAAFGTRLRCSGCHVNGGPIMKELASPHNDWWSASSPLPRGGREFDSRMTAIAAGFVGGDDLAANVRAGLDKLNASPKFLEIRKRRPLPEQLRPLFCPVEINLESDSTPLDKTTSTKPPSGLLVDPRLARGPLEVSRADYAAGLSATGSAFPEIDRRDADHAWLGPVKAVSDQLAAQALVSAGIVDDEFVADVLAVDFTNPALSTARCRLLKLVPAEATSDWPARFRTALAGSTEPAAQALLQNLTVEGRTASAHRQRGERFLEACRERLKTPDFVVAALKLVAQRRAEVAANEISSSRNQILEPTFRVIFPTQTRTPAPGTLRLSESCEIVGPQG